MGGLTMIYRPITVWDLFRMLWWAITTRGAS